jgi:hypothetical protein
MVAAPRRPMAACTRRKQQRDTTAVALSQLVQSGRLVRLGGDACVQPNAQARLPFVGDALRSPRR